MRWGTFALPLASFTGLLLVVWMALLLLLFLTPALLLFLGMTMAINDRGELKRG